MASPRLLLNPSASRGRAASRLRGVLREVPFDVRTVTAPQEMTDAARTAVGEGLERLFVAGGDGSVHYAIQGLAGTMCALAIVPLGTGNDLARTLGIRLDPLAAVRQALGGKFRSIDLGRVDGRWFACVAGVGIDGDVAERVRRPSRRLGGPLAYVWALAQVLRRFEPPDLEVCWDGGRYSGPVTLAAIANGPLFGGGMRIAPRAVIDDGRLDGVIVGRIPKPLLLALFPRIYSGGHVDHPAVQTFRTRSATLCTGPNRRFWADGEPLCPCSTTGTHIAVQRHALRVLV